jgi:hypothetical protein
MNTWRKRVKAFLSGIHSVVAEILGFFFPSREIRAE